MKGNYNCSSNENYNHSSNVDINNVDFNSIFSSFSGDSNSSESNNNSSGSNNNSSKDSTSGVSNDNNGFNFFNFFNNQNDSQNDNDNSSNPFGNIDIGTIMKLKSVMDKMKSPNSDPRSNLLRSLKPYLKPSRKEQVDKYIQLFSMSQVFEGMNKFGGDKKNDV